jgi:deoxyribose-phosphate aldolase
MIAQSVDINALDQHWQALLAAATTARARAYAPYSSFSVGAALRAGSGRIYAGANVENASSGLTVCAERVAIWKAVSEGERRIEALAVITEGGATPCGACRQVLVEFEADLPVLVADTDGNAWMTSLVVLLPDAFPRVCYGADTVCGPVALSALKEVHMVAHDSAWSDAAMARANEILAAWAGPGADLPTRSMKAAEIARYIDHTLLKSDATPDAVVKLCAEAAEGGFASVCVNSSHVALCAERLQGSRTAVCSVVGFPLGAALTDAKVAEARLAMDAGATEIDMVIAVGYLKAGRVDRVCDDIAAVAAACHARGVLLKVIIETCLLTDVEKTAACLAIVEAGADFCKTSTGFSTAGATVHDVALMRHVVGPNLGVKAAGGVRTYADAMAMISAGATRIGASSSLQILGGAAE